jgi:hypothetical protein
MHVKVFNDQLLKHQKMLPMKHKCIKKKSIECKNVQIMPKHGKYDYIHDWVNNHKKPLQLHVTIVELNSSFLPSIIFWLLIINVMSHMVMIIFDINISSHHTFLSYWVRIQNYKINNFSKI